MKLLPIAKQQVEINWYNRLKIERRIGLKFPFHDPILYDLVNVQIPLNNLESYAKHIEAFLDNKFMETVIEREEEEENGFFDKDEMEVRDEDGDNSFIKIVNSFTFFQQDRYRYAIDFPNIMRTSLFYSCFSFLENYLFTVCKDLRNKKKIDLDLSDIKHNGIEKAQVYLKKVVGLNFPDQSIEWNHIKKCNKIRNILIHNGGLIDRDNKKIPKDIESVKGVKIEREIPLMYGKIMLKESFCFDFINCIRILIDALSKEIQEIIDFNK